MNCLKSTHICIKGEIETYRENVKETEKETVEKIQRNIDIDKHIKRNMNRKRWTGIPKEAELAEWGESEGKDNGQKERDKPEKKGVLRHRHR